VKYFFRCPWVRGNFEAVTTFRKMRLLEDALFLHEIDAHLPNVGILLAICVKNYPELLSFLNT
jgi:hypothetical protein